MTLDDFLLYLGMLLMAGGGLFGLSREIADHGAEAGAIVLAVLQ